VALKLAKSMVSLNSDSQYLHFSANAAFSDVLIVRKVLSDALTQQFGMTSAGIHLDILWLKDDGSEFIIRTHRKYVYDFLSIVSYSYSGLI